MKLAYAFNVSSAGTRVGLIVFNRDAKILIRLDDLGSQSPRAVKQVLEPEVRDWKTRTDKALEKADELFTAEKGERKDKPNVLIVVTDGKARGVTKPFSVFLDPLIVSSLQSYVYMYVGIYFGR